MGAAIMTHFRGLPSRDYKTWQPICSTRELPVTGECSTHAGDIDCPTCRKVLRLNAVQWAAPKAPP
jgi:hypothetical protein